MRIPERIMHFRNEKASELRRFADLLEIYVGIGSSQQIFPAIKQLQNEEYIPALKTGERNVNFWGYSIDGLTIPIETLKHIKPEGFESAEAILDVSLISDFREWDKLNDPFCDLNFRATIRGINPSKKGVHHFGFHIDRHPEAYNSKEIHPLYHLHYEQNPQGSKSFDYGETIFLDTPRIIHLPMDLVLGMGYLISNFAPSIYEKIQEDRSYIKLTKEYQNKIWRPYFQTIASHWPYNTRELDWDTKLLCPYLV